MAPQFPGANYSNAYAHGSIAPCVVRKLCEGLRPWRSTQLWPWLLVITGCFYGIIHSINGDWLVLNGYKWDYTFYKWGFVSTCNWYLGHNCSSEARTDPPGNKCSELPGCKQVWANENWGEKSWRLFFIAIEIIFELDMLATSRATDAL